MIGAPWHFGRVARQTANPLPHKRREPFRPDRGVRGVDNETVVALDERDQVCLIERHAGCVQFVLDEVCKVGPGPGCSSILRRQVPSAIELQRLAPPLSFLMTEISHLLYGTR